MKQNLTNSLILPPKNGGLKAWSHSVRKANWVNPVIGWSSVAQDHLCKLTVQLLICTEEQIKLVFTYEKYI